MNQMIEVLMIGGCEDGEKRHIARDLHVFTVEVREPTVYQMIALAAQPVMPRYTYHVQTLHEAGQDFRVAVWEGHDRPLIQTLIDGYKA